MSAIAILRQLFRMNTVNDSERQHLIKRAEQLNTMNFDADEIVRRVREVSSEYLIEAKVDVDRLLTHQDWRVRSAALDLVWWGLGVTDGIDRTIAILLHDDDEDVRSEAALALYEVSRGTPKQREALEAFGLVIDNPESPAFLRDEVTEYRSKLLDKTLLP